MKGLNFYRSVCMAVAFVVIPSMRYPPIAKVQDLDDATIGGRVLDQNGAVIPGASVSATSITTGATRKTAADTEGRYRLVDLEPGTYTVRASRDGFASTDKSNVTTGAGQVVKLELVLIPAGVTAEATVQADGATPLVDTTRTIVGSTLTNKETEALPNFSRSPLDLVFTLGGVTEEPLSTRELSEDRNVEPRGAPEEAGIFALSGGPAYSNNITIDGLDNNDDRAARERFLPSIEAVAEVQVVTNQFSAEYGRASGGRVNIRTSSGAAELRGRAFAFFRDDILNANTYKNNTLGLKRLPLTELNPGFTLSGPLRLPGILETTQFFLAYEYNKVADNALIDTLVPIQQSDLFRLPLPSTLSGMRIEDVNPPTLAAEVAPYTATVSTPVRNMTLTVRVDHQFSEEHNATFAYQLGRLNNLRQFGGGNRLADALQGKTRNSDSLSYSDTYVISPSAVNQIRLQLSNLTPALTAKGGASPVVLISLNDPLGSGDPFRRTGTLVAGSSTAGGSDRRETRFQIQESLTYLRGSHTLKAGVDFQRIRSTFIDLSDITGTFNFASAGDFLAGVPSRYRQNFIAESTQRNTYLGLFVLDEWRVRPNITLSFGLRFDNESIVRDRNNFAPRAAIAYDPLQDGKTVVRLGAGAFFNRALLRTIDDFTLGNQQLFFDTNALRDPVTGRLLTAAQRRAFIAANISFPQTFDSRSAVVDQYATRNSSFLRRLDPELRIPESYQFNLGVERQIGRAFAVEANYSVNRGLHLWREFNSNAPVKPLGYNDLTEYLLARDFPNFLNVPGGIRPIYDASGAGQLVRFTLVPFDPANPARCPSPFNPSNPNVVGCVVESGIPITLINLNSFTSSTSVDAALAALRDLRPDPSRGEIEQLASIGNSFYHGLTLEFRRRSMGDGTGFDFSFRAAYTLSHLVDDGIVNTSDAIVPADFRRERARSLLDRRHRFVLSGTFLTPRYLGSLSLSPLFRMASGAPFNISIGGADRNLDDVSNDRPIYTGETSRLRARHPGQPADPTLLDLFSLPTIGRTGNLPRNAGIGPGIFALDLNVTREFKLNDRVKLRPLVEVDNLLNKTVWSFGSDFIDAKAVSPDATPEEREEAVNSFLLTTHTMRQRTVRLGIRIDF